MRATVKKILKLLICYSSSLFSLMLFLIPDHVNAASTCGIGLILSPTPVEIDGQKTGTEWDDASHLKSGDGCLENFIDWDNVLGGIENTGKIHVWSKRYTRDGNQFFGFLFEVPDRTTTYEGGMLINGEKIIIQFNRDINGDDTQLQAEDRRVEVTHKWNTIGGGADPDEITPTTVFVYDPLPTANPICGQTWSATTTDGSNVDVDAKIRAGLSGGGYTLELEVPASLLGNPSDDIGISFAIINDFGKSDTSDFDCGPGGVCDGSGIGFPADIAIANDHKPLGMCFVGCDPGEPSCDTAWIRPEDWGVGFFSDPPGDVTLSHDPKYWKSKDVDGLLCGTTWPDDVDNSYYPGGACKLRVWSYVHNSSGVNQVRNLLFLRGDHSAGVTQWEVIDFKKNQVIPPNPASAIDAAHDPGTEVLSKEADSSLLSGLLGHPCVRIYVLPRDIDSAFDEDDINNIQTGDDLDELVSVYGIGSNQSAQQNISRRAEESACPEEDCLYSSLKRYQQIRLAMADSPKAIYPLTNQGEIVSDVRFLSQATTASYGVSRTVDTYNSSAHYDVTDDLPPLVEHFGNTVRLPDHHKKRYSQNHAILQVKAFGYRQINALETKPTYNFIEEVGGVVDLIPMELINDQQKVAIQFNVGNTADVTRKIFLQVDLQVPNGVEEMEVALDSATKEYGPWQSRTFTVVVGRNLSISQKYPWAISLRGGFNTPHSRLSNVVDTGVSFNLGLEYLFKPNLSAEVIMGYHGFGDDGLGSDLDIYQFSLNGRYYPFQSRITPFVNAGAGYYLVDPGDDGIGFNIGTGFDYDLNPPWSVEGAYNYHKINSGNIDPEFSVFQIGLKYRF